MKTGSRRRRLAVVMALAAGTAALFGPRSSAQRFSEWSAPVNLGPIVNSGFFDG